jgi:hypothetical protein
LHVSYNDVTNAKTSLSISKTALQIKLRQIKLLKNCREIKMSNSSKLSKYTFVVLLLVLVAAINVQHVAGSKQFTVEGYNLLPTEGWKTGNVKGYCEDDLVPIRLNYKFKNEPATILVFRVGGDYYDESKDAYGFDYFSEFTISGDYVSATINYVGSPDGPYNFPWSGGFGTGEMIDLAGDRGLTVRYIIEVQIPAVGKTQKEFTIEFLAHESLTEFSDVSIVKRGSYYWGSANLLVGKDPRDDGKKTISIKKCDVEPQPPTTVTTTSTTTTNDTTSTTKLTITSITKITTSATSITTTDTSITDTSTTESTSDSTTTDTTTTDTTTETTTSDTTTDAISSTTTSTTTSITVTVQLLDVDGNGLAGGQVTYVNGSWQSFGTTDADGTVTKDFPDTTTNLRVKLTYNQGSRENTQNIQSLPVFTFQTVKATVKLIDHVGDGLQGGRVQQGGGYWQEHGYTDQNGEVFVDMFPGSYRFRLTYNYVSEEKNQDIATPVVFQTGQVYSDFSGSIQASLGGGWHDFTKPSMELMPGTYLFNFGPPLSTSEQVTVVAGTTVYVPTTTTTTSTSTTTTDTSTTETTTETTTSNTTTDDISSTTVCPTVTETVIETITETETFTDCITTIGATTEVITATTTNTETVTDYTATVTEIIVTTTTETATDCTECPDSYCIDLGTTGLSLFGTIKCEGTNVYVGGTIDAVGSRKPSGTSVADSSDAAAATLLWGMCSDGALYWDIDNASVSQTDGHTLVAGHEVMSGGPIVNGPVRYYEKQKLAPLYFARVSGKANFFSTEGTPETSDDTQIIDAQRARSEIGLHKDVFVIELFQKPGTEVNPEYVVISYGYTARGTLAASIYFKEVIEPNLSNYTDAYYIFQWDDTNNNSHPDVPGTDTFTLITSGT